MKTTLVNSAKWCLGVASLSLATIANAELVKNGSFDGAGGWSYSNDNVAVFPGEGIDSLTTPGDPTKAGGYRPPRIGEPSGFISQTISPLNKNESYLLEFYLRSVGGVTITFDFGGNSFSDFNPGNIDPFSDNELHFIRAGQPPEWTYYSTVISDFTGGVISFTFSGVGENAEGFVDDVSLTCENGSVNLDCSTGNNVPEPGSLLLVGAALAGLGLARRRKSA